MAFLDDPDFELTERASNGRTAVPPTRKVTMHVSASVQTGPQGLPASHVSAIRGRGVGLTPRGWAGGTPRAGSARLSHRLTPVVTSSIDRKIFILSCGSENGDSGVSAPGCDEDPPCSERPSLLRSVGQANRMPHDVQPERTTSIDSGLRPGGSRTELRRHHVIGS